MDYFRRFLGLPRESEQVPFMPRNDIIHPDGLFIPEQEFEDFEEIEQPGMHGLFGQMDQELREMERQMKDMWSAFGMGPSLFTDDFSKLFEGFGSMPGMLPPGHSVPALPAPNEPGQEADSLRRNMLKPSLVPPAASPGQRKDEDLDNKIQNEGISALLEQPKPRHHHDQMPPMQFRNFSKSISIQTVRRPDGSMETRKVERDSDGHETITITEHAPDGAGPSNWPFGPVNPNQDPNDPKGLSILDKFFKR